MGQHLDKEQRRSQLIQAALAAFGKKGYHDTQVSDIIAQAKVARGTFYLYFEGKREIFEAIIGQIFQGIAEQIRALPLDAVDQIPTQILGNLRRVTALLMKNPLWIKLVFSDAVGLDSEFDAHIRNFYELVLDYIRRGLKQGQRMGFVREGDVGVLAVCVLGAVKEVFYQYVLGTEKPEVRDIEREIYTFVITGIIHPSLRPHLDEMLQVFEGEEEPKKARSR
jgi:AcrR family transcriptional regulator